MTTLRTMQPGITTPLEQHRPAGSPLLSTRLVNPHAKHTIRSSAQLESSSSAMHVCRRIIHSDCDYWKFQGCCVANLETLSGSRKARQAHVRVEI
jgi:hypothetical protein